MKTTLSYLLVLLTFGTLTFLSDSHAQGASLQPTVQLVYFLPKDRPARPERVTALRELITDVQEFYAQQMEHHGYGRKTFRVETDKDGTPVVQQVHGKFNEAYYQNAWEDIFSHMNDPQRIFFIAIDISQETLETPNGRAVCGAGKGYYEPRRKRALIPASGDCFNLRLAAHELGHTFALEHDFRDDAYIMSYGSKTPQLSKCAAEWLDTHSFFNNVSVQINGSIRIRMLAPTAAPPNGIRLRFSVNEVDRLHQAMLYLKPTLADPANDFKLDGCHLLDAKSNTIEFVTSGLVDPSQDEVTLQVIDKRGGMIRQTFPIRIANLLPPPKYVSIPDQNLARAVREELHLDKNARITDRQMRALRRLRAEDSNIKNLAGLEHATELVDLFLGRNTISNYDPLAQLSKLKRLLLWANGISDLNVLPPMPQLEFLDLNWNQISNLSPLAKFTSLKELWLQGNKLTDTSTLFQLHNGTFPLGEEVEVVKERDNSDRAYTLLILQSLDLKVRVNPDATVYRSLNAVQNARQTVTTTNEVIEKDTPATNVVVEDPTPATNVVVEDAGHLPMYWINTKTGTLHRLVDTEVENLVPRFRNANSLAVDVGGGKLYWTEQTSDKTGRIRRANLDGTNVQLVKDLTSVPHGIALDTANGKIYLTNAWGKIQRLNVDGSNFQPNLITGLDTPRSIALDISNGKVYWAEITGRIRRSNLDGSNVQGVVTGLGTPMDLVVFDGTIYWTEMTGENRGEIQRVNLDGTDPEMLLTLTSVPHGIAIDPMENKLYWTNSRGKIQRANLDGSDFQPNLVTGLTSPGSIAVEVKPKEILATDALLSVSPSPVTSPSVGERLTLNVNITAGAAVAGYQVTVQFDTTALRYVESSNGDYLPDGAFFLPPVVKGNRVELASSTLTGVSNGDGTLATITFEVLAVKASTLTLSDMLLADSQGNTFRPQVEMGEVTEPPKLKADINGDGLVNIQDLVLVASNFGKRGQNSADVNADGVVNIADLVLVAGSLGTGLGAPSLHPSALEMLTAADVQEWLSQAHQLDSDYTGYQRGLLVLEHFLAALIPKETSLLPNYPNPFNPETWIPYQLSKSADVTLHIYAANGRLVRTLTLGHQPAGIYQNRSRAAYWDGRNELGEKVASGIYFYTLSADDFTATRKMLIMK